MKIIALGMLGALLCATPAIAKDTAPQFKSVEAKHFPRAEGVELSPAFSDYLYAELRAELTKAKLFGQVLGEDEVVDQADAAKSLLIVGTISEYKKGSLVKDALIGFGAGMRSLKVDATVSRRSNQQSVTAIHVHVKVSPRWDEKVMARFAAKNIVKQLKDSLKGETLAS